MIRNKKFFNDHILKWFKEHKRTFLWRENKDAFTILIAEVFLKKTRAGNAEKEFKKFISKYKNFKQIARAQKNVLNRYFSSLGLLDRGEGLKKMAQQICDKHNGLIPERVDDLKNLYLIGDYSANAVLCFGFGRKTAIVDVNVIRIFDRFFGYPIKQKSPHKDPQIWSFAKSILPSKFCKEFNWGLLDFGALICTKNKPKCFICPLKNRCIYFKNKVNL